MEAEAGRRDAFNFPAVARIEGRGTAFLVATGVLMTNTKVIPSRMEAQKLKAIFLEGSKKGERVAKLLPDRLFFRSLMPDNIDYCLVACDTTEIFNIKPISVPLVRKEWVALLENYSVYCIQHPDGNSPAEFREVSVQRMGDVSVNVKAPRDAHVRNGGPAFVQSGHLVGIQVQAASSPTESSVVLISAIVKHLFANGMLHHLQRPMPIDLIWGTYFITDDPERLIAIMNNFPLEELRRQGTQKLCEFAAAERLRAAVLSSGAIAVLIRALTTFEDDEGISTQILRALWNLSYGGIDGNEELHQGGLLVVQKAVKTFSGSEDAVTFGTVLMYNVSQKYSYIDDTWAPQAIEIVGGAISRFPGAEVLHKFGLKLLTNILMTMPSLSQRLDRAAAVKLMADLMKTRGANVYLMEAVVEFLGVFSQCYPDDAALIACVSPLIETMARHGGSRVVAGKGNEALWVIGRQLACRIAIFKHPRAMEVIQSSLATLEATLPAAELLQIARGEVE